MTEVQWTATIRFGELTPSSASLGWATAPSTVRIHENRASTPASANTSTGSTTIRTSSQFPSQRRQQPLQQLPQLQLQQQRLVPRQLRPQRLHRRLLLQQLEAQDSIVCKLFFPKCSLLITGHETSSSNEYNYTNEYVIDDADRGKPNGVYPNPYSDCSPTFYKCSNYYSYEYVSRVLYLSLWYSSIIAVCYISCLL